MTDADNKQPQRPEGNAPRGSRRNQPPVGASSPDVKRPSRGTPGGSTRKYKNQQEREAMYHRWLYIGLGIAAGLIILALAAGALWQFQIMPNQTLVTVNGEKITRKDYWKYQSINLYNQARLYENMALEYTGQEQSQFLLYSAQLDSARNDISGSTTVDSTTLQQMIEDKLYVQAAEERGIDMSEPLLKQTALNTWAPADAPLITPIPSPTLIPERAEWATQTAEALQTQEAETSALLGTPVASPVVNGATPVVTAVATTNMAIVQQDAESEYQNFLATALKESGLTEQEYLDLFAKPKVARAQIDAEIAASIPQSAPQIEVSHILVSTEELANQIYNDISDGQQSFGQEASLFSLDSATASNDGKLGWVAKGELPEAVEDIAFSMKPGEMSRPIESPFGWHIIMVTDTDADRALTRGQYENAIAAAKREFLEQLRTENTIKSEYYNPTVAPTATTFTPPVNAPTPVVVTPVPAPDWSLTPVAGPDFQFGTPVASPAATP